MFPKNNEVVPSIRFNNFTDDWEQCKLGEVLNYEQPTKYIVSSTDYDDGFSIPVLTAGQSFILGYTNETNGIKEADENNPVIIFDDFTTSSHYVDFPFKVKSSAMKLLDLKGEGNEFYFIYNALKNIKYIPRNHERHWISIFSDFEIMLPEFEEQKKIGMFLKDLDHLITLHQHKLKNLEQTKKGLLQKVFPKNNEVIPDLRFSNFTNEWEQCKLKEVANYRNGKAHEKTIVEDGKYIVVNSKFVSTEGKIKKYSNELIEPLRYGDIAFVLSDVPKGKAIAKTFLIDYENKYRLNQRIAGITAKNNIDSYFLNILINRNSYFLRFDDGVKQTNLTKSDVENFIEYYPSYCEQQKIGSFFKSLDNLITLNHHKLENLEKTKKGLLQKMFV